MVTARRPQNPVLRLGLVPWGHRDTRPHLGSFSRRSLCHGPGAQKSKSEVSLGRTVPACHQLLTVPAVPGALGLQRCPSDDLAPVSLSVSRPLFRWRHQRQQALGEARPAQDHPVCALLLRSTMAPFPHIGRIWRLQKGTELGDTAQPRKAPEACGDRMPPPSVNRASGGVGLPMGGIPAKENSPLPQKKPPFPSGRRGR